MKHNLLKSIFISLILLMGVGNVWGDDISAGSHIYLVNTGNWSGCQLYIWKSDYNTYYTFSKITNTNIYHYYFANSWNGYEGVKFRSDVNWTKQSSGDIKQNLSSCYFVGTGTTKYTTLANMNGAAKVVSMVSTGGNYTEQANSSCIAKVSGYNLAANASSTKAVNASTGSASNASISAAYGSTITYTATAGTGYTFKGFSTSNSTSLPSNPSASGKTATANKYGSSASNTTYYAYFILDQYTITYTLNGGSGTMTPTTYTVETATFNLPTPTKAGSTFEGWYTTSDFSGSKVTQITKGSTGNKTFYAKWTAIAETKYAVTISSGANGSVSPSGSQQVGASGISVTATPSTGYKFKEWTVTGGANVASATAATTTVTATAQGTVEASFEEELYDITVTSNNAAYGDVNPKAPKAGIKTTAEIEATPYDGYEFVEWTAPSSITLENANNASTTITKATANGTVSATFQEIEYTITIKSSDANQGTVTPTSSQVGKHRAVTITATPKTGYRFKNWTFTTGITITDANNATTTIKATQIGTVTAHFEVKPIDRYIKHDWDGDAGNDWSWKLLTAQTDGTYTLQDKWYGSGVNINTKNNDTNATWFPTEQIMGASLIENGSDVIYIYNPTTNTMSMTFVCPEEMYIKHDWDGNESGGWTWKEMTKQSDETFILEGQKWYGNGVNIDTWENTAWEGIPFFSTDKVPFGSEVIYIYNPRTKTFTVTYINLDKCYIKHPWNGSTWSWKEMTKQSDGTFMYEGKWQENGVNINGQQHENAQLYFEAANVNNPNNIKKGEDVLYVYNPYNNELSILGKGSYRLKSTYTDNGTPHVLYSNYVMTEGEIMSVYSRMGGTLTLEKYSDGWVTRDSKVSTYTDVIVAPLAAGEKIGDITIYEGDFYIRTDMAPGGWNSYKQESHAFTNFNKYEDETFNHYWVGYTENANVKARIANDYNNSLATELGDYNVSVASVRFSYNNETNEFDRAFLGGSTNNSEFLRLVIDNADFSKGITFGDISNWVYEVTTKVKKGQIADVRAKHQNVNFNEPYNLRDDVKLLGENSSEGEQTIRVIYDFKKNRMICGWLPDDVTDHDGELVIDADMLIVRVDDNDAPVINMKTVNDKISDLNRLYFVLELNKGTVVGGKKIFWFSLPFECKLKDVFGIEGYGTKWVVQRYRGDKRAELGFRPEIETFWANMKQSNTATLEPNRGYVLSLNLKESDFKSIDVDEDGDGNKITKSLLRLYFPSNATEFTLSKDNDMTVEVPEHLCEVNDPEHNRKPLDSHWNIIGVPGYQPVTVNGYTASYPEGGYYPPTEEPDDPTAEQPTNGNYAPNFLYTWNGTKDDYTVQDGSNFTYKHFYSYMVQFAGTIDWSQYTQSTNPAAAPRRVAKKADKQYKVVLGENGANVDQTFITLSEKGNHDYSIGNDLEKIGSTSVARIYTQEGNWNLAANHLSDTTTVLPLTLSIPAEGEYTLSLEQGRYSSDALLYDSENGTYTDLSKEGYTFTAEAGVNNERFALRFGMKLPGGNPTDLQQTQAHYLVRTEGQRIIIEGMAGDVRLYDMTGRVMTQQRAENYTEITVPVTGVYVLQVGNQFEKMIIK